MKILLLNHYAGNPELGMEFRPYYFASEWGKMGHEVRIIAGDYSHLRIKNPKIEKDFQKNNIGGVEYYWIRTGKYNGNGMERALSMFRFVAKIWLNTKKIVKQWKPDVVISSSTYPLDTYAAQKIAKRAGANLIHEVHDMWPSTLYEIGGMSKYHPFVILIQLAENSAYKHSNHVVSLLPLSKNYMLHHGMSEQKFCFIPNGIYQPDWDLRTEIPEEHKNCLLNLKRKNKFIVGYFGGFSRGNAMNVLIEAAKCCQDSDICFVLTGDGIEKEKLIKQVEKEKINNVIFLPPVKKTEIPDLIKYYDCSYMGSPYSPLYRFGVCVNKMYDSMMAGKPIICSITTPITVIRECKCGFQIPSGDVNEILRCINQLKNMTEGERQQMGLNGKKEVLRYYTYEILSKKFSELFDNR